MIEDEALAGARQRQVFLHGQMVRCLIRCMCRTSTPKDEPKRSDCYHHWDGERRETEKTSVVSEHVTWELLPHLHVTLFSWGHTMVSGAFLIEVVGDIK